MSLVLRAQADKAPLEAKRRDHVHVSCVTVLLITSRVVSMRFPVSAVVSRAAKSTPQHSYTGSPARPPRRGVLDNFGGLCRTNRMVDGVEDPQSVLPPLVVDIRIPHGKDFLHSTGRGDPEVAD